MSRVCPRIDAAFATAGAYTQSSAYMKSLSLFRMTPAVRSSSASTESYIFRRLTLPIGFASSGRPKYPVKGFSQITCLPAFRNSAIMGAWSCGGVQMSTTSMSGSLMRSW